MQFLPLMALCRSNYSNLELLGLCMFRCISILFEIFKICCLGGYYICSISPHYDINSFKIKKIFG